MKKTSYIIGLFIFSLCLSIGFSAPNNGQSAKKKKEVSIENFARYANANRNVKTAPIAVFMGDSITDGWARQHPEFFSDNNYIGRGISGQTTCQMLARLRPDAIELKPKFILILGGTNDIAQNNGPIEIDNIVGNIISMCELAKFNGITPVICSVLPAHEYAWRKHIKPTEKISELNTKLKAYAENTEGVEYLDYYSSLVDSRKGLSKEDSRDGCHPTLSCYKDKMEPLAKAFIEKLQKKYSK